MGTAFSCAVNFYASVVTFCRVGARGRERAEPKSVALSYSSLRHLSGHDFNQRGNFAVALRGRGKRLSELRRLLFSPIRPSLEIQPKNGATSPFLLFQSSSSLLFFITLEHVTRARVAERGNLASSQNRAELIGKLQGSAVGRPPKLIHCPLFLISSRTLRRPSPTPLPASQQRRRPQARQGLHREQRHRRRIRPHVRRRREAGPHRSLRSSGPSRVSSKACMHNMFSACSVWSFISSE